MRILCFGDSQGNFQRTFEKANLLLKKQHFDCLLCVGNLFSASTSNVAIEDLLDGKIKIALPTYFAHGPSGLPASILARSREEQICENLFLLQEARPLQLRDGPRVGFSSSAKNKGIKDQPAIDLSVFDILLCQHEPADISTSLSSDFSPRYIIYAASEFAEKAPRSVETTPGASMLTREIGLASVANPMRSKWFYAFNLTIGTTDQQVLAQAPAFDRTGISDATKQSESDLRMTSSDPVSIKRPPENYVCKICSQKNTHYFRDCPQRTSLKRKRGLELIDKQPKIVDPSSCFFCLANPDLARHLIVSIGDAGSYLVLPKGGMTQNHVIILPIDHKPTLASLQESRSAVETEMQRYIDALQLFYESIDTVGIVFQISRSSGVHFHMQMMPVPRSKLADLKDAFHAFAETQHINLSEELPAENEDFFCVSFPSLRLSLYGCFHANTRFDLQFGRRVISDVMGVPERAHWKDCLRSEAQELADAELFKAAFKPFDFTL